MAQLPVIFSMSATDHLIATITGSGSGGVENGLALISQPFTIDGQGEVDLGSATQGISSFQFTLGDDSAAFLVAIAPDFTFTVLDAPGLVGETGPTPSPDLLQRYWSGLTPEVATAALQGAVNDWIVANAVGAPVLLVVGFVSGGGAFFLAAAAKTADLVALFFIKVAAQESSNGNITPDEAKLIQAWAKVGDTSLQLPAILTDESELAKVAGLIAAEVNFSAESETAKLGVTWAADGVAKYVLALEALAK